MMQYITWCEWGQRFHFRKVTERVQKMLNNQLESFKGSLLYKNNNTWMYVRSELSKEHISRVNKRERINVQNNQRSRGTTFTEKEEKPIILLLKKSILVETKIIMLKCCWSSKVTLFGNSNNVMQQAKQCLKQIKCFSWIQFVN